MKKIFIIVSFAILSVYSASAQVKFDTFVDKIHYGMTESDLVREFGDNMRYYVLEDKTIREVLDHNLTNDLHKLNLTDNFHIIPKTFSNYEIELQLNNYVMPFTISLDSLSGAVRTLCFASKLGTLNASELMSMFKSVFGKPDKFNNYYYSNCLININKDYYLSRFVVTIALTDHKMTTDEFEKYGIQQVHMQDEFLGIPLYSTYRAADRIMSSRGYVNYSSDNNELIYENVNFAGMYWDGCVLTFKEKKFTEIRFFQSSSSEKMTLEIFQDLRARLQKKYSIDDGFFAFNEDLDWESDKTIDITLGSEYSTVLCCLRVAYVPSQKFDEHYHLMLSYYDSHFVKNQDDDL